MDTLPLLLIVVAWGGVLLVVKMIPAARRGDGSARFGALISAGVLAVLSFLGVFLAWLVGAVRCDERDRAWRFHESAWQ